jgi:P-type Cu+ transporter
MPLPHAEAVSPQTSCYHCGDPVPSDAPVSDGKAFCCKGCRAVYDLLEGHRLGDYYRREKSPGLSPRFGGDTRYAYLDDPEVVGGLLDFTDGTTHTTTLTIPGMHCASCVWLLENLHGLDSGIVHSRVDFLKKQLFVGFAHGTTLRKVVELLASLGYEPEITLASPGERTQVRPMAGLYARIGVAGFCFANIMMLSFPHYLAGGEPELGKLFSALNVTLSLPVLLYSAQDFFRSAAGGVQRGIINLDVPIALGILILFVRSLVDIMSGAGPGFLDSMSGLVFFLLVGKVFQAKTYDTLNFERTYKAYFPLAVTVRDQDGERSVPVSKLAVGERMVVRNGDIIPADAVMMHGRGLIDYSFVTGESTPVERVVGDLVHAGGRQRGGAIELEVVREVSQSYLTSLWNEHGGQRDEARSLVTVSNAVARYFTAGVLLAAGVTGLYWFPRDAGIALDAVTGVLIVACPCALALATPFAFGTMMRLFGRRGFYLKNAGVVEQLARVSTIVFDKTGTLTHAGGVGLQFEGAALSQEDAVLVASLAQHSSHPLSRALTAALQGDASATVEEFREIPGEGIEGTVDGHAVRLGSSQFVAGSDGPLPERTHVAVGVDGSTRGIFVAQTRFRDGLEKMFAALQGRYRLGLLSGDTAADRLLLQNTLGGTVDMQFGKSPSEKREHVRELRKGGAVVMMVGDGLNDAVALQEGDVGIAVSEDAARFTPASDGILHGGSFQMLPAFLDLSRAAVRIVLVSFGISFLYNAAVLWVAVHGNLSPVVAAILMPLSSITVVLLSTMLVRMAARRKGIA